MATESQDMAAERQDMAAERQDMMLAAATKVLPSVCCISGSLPASPHRSADQERSRVFLEICRLGKYSMVDSGSLRVSGNGGGYLRSRR